MQIHRRRIDEYGRITIPSSMREELNLKPGDKLELTLTRVPFTRIELSSVAHRCIICGNPTERIYKKQFVCEKCVADHLNVTDETESTLS